MSDRLVDLLGEMYKNTPGAELAGARADIAALKAKLATAEKTIATLRESKTFYQDNYRKARAAYERVVSRDA